MATAHFDIDKYLRIDSSSWFWKIVPCLRSFCSTSKQTCNETNSRDTASSSAREFRAVETKDPIDFTSVNIVAARLPAVAVIVNGSISKVEEFYRTRLFLKIFKVHMYGLRELIMKQRAEAWTRYIDLGCR